jgi:very-short-patch-repair endonuclease
MKYSEVKRFASRMRRRPTSSEERMWDALKHRNFEGIKFLRQHPLMYDRIGNDVRYFIPDFYCPSLKLVIEIDGGIHDQQREYDAWRQAILEKKGLKVIRFRNEELNDLNNVLEKIKTFIPIPPSPGDPHLTHSPGPSP